MEDEGDCDETLSLFQNREQTPNMLEVPLTGHVSVHEVLRWSPSDISSILPQREIVVFFTHHQHPYLK